MNTKWLTILLVLIITLAIGLRFYQLGSIPDGMTWDEAAIGYNGYSVWHIHRDEWLEFMPISFRSFGDYKAPAAIYLTGIFTSLFGLSSLSVRLPFALASVLAILSMYGLVKTVLQSLKVRESTYLSHTILALIAALLLACSPWHLLFSRVGFESGMALTCIVWATWLLLLSQKKRTKVKPWLSFMYLFLAAGLFSLSPYIYHSAKIFTPLFLFFLVILLLKEKLMGWKPAVALGCIFLLGLIPLFYDVAFGHALERGGVTVFSQSDSIMGVLIGLASGFAAHLSPHFLLLGATDTLRHSTGVYGVLSVLNFGLVVMAVGWLVLLGIRRRPVSNAALVWLSIIWIVTGIIPAAMGTEVPHPNRALLALPGFILLAVWFISQVLSWVTHKWTTHTAQRIAIALVVCLILGEAVSALFFAWIYFGRYQQTIADAYLSGYVAAAQLAYEYSQGRNHPEVNQVVFTSTYGQPYIFTLFANHLSSVAYHNGVLVKFLFPDQVTVGDLDRQNTLVVAGQKDKLDAQPIQVIVDKSGQPRFYFYLSHGADQ